MADKSVAELEKIIENAEASGIRVTSDRLLFVIAQTLLQVLKEVKKNGEAQD